MAQDVEEGRSLELSYYGAVIRRRWRIVLGGVLVGVIGSIAYLALLPKTATATATVNVNVISSQPFTTDKPASQLLDTETELQVATSAQVLGVAAQDLANGKSLTQMRAKTTVQPVAGATIVKISYSAPSKDQAVAGADAIAKAYLAYRAKAASDKVSKVIDRLSKQRDSLKAELTRANGRLANARTGSPVAVQAESDRELTNIELTSVVSQINQLDSVDTSGGTLLSAATENSVKFSPSPKLIVGAGTLLGLIVGVLLAFVVNAWDRRVADGRALSGLGGGEILAALKAHRASVPAEGVDLDQIRGLRERLLASIGRGGNLVVIDLVIRDRPSDIAVNLALSLVESGGSVRLVLPEHSEENLQVLGRTLDLQPIEGATDSWSYTSAWAQGLDVVFTHEDQELGAPGDRLGNILSESHESDLTTLVAMPPKASRSLWLTAGRLGHSIILVAARRETRVSAVRQLVKELGAVGAVIHGSVLVPRRRSVEMKPAKRPSSATVPQPAVAEARRPDPTHLLDDAATITGPEPGASPSTSVDDRVVPEGEYAWYGDGVGHEPVEDVRTGEPPVEDFDDLDQSTSGDETSARGVPSSRS